MLHDFTQLAQMRQTSGHVQEPLAFTRFHMTFDKQEAILEQVTDFLLDILTSAGSAACFFIFGRWSTALQLGLEWAKRSRSLAAPSFTPLVRSLIIWKVQS